MAVNRTEEGGFVEADKNFLPPLIRIFQQLRWKIQMRDLGKLFKFRLRQFRLFHDCEERSDWDRPHAAVERNRNDSSRRGMLENKMTPAPAGENKTVFLKDADNLFRGEGAHAEDYRPAGMRTRTRSTIG